MWAAGGCDRDLALAEWADLGGWFCWSFWFLADGHELVDGLEQQEQHKGHDEEVDEGRNEVGAETKDILEGVGLGTGDKVEDRVDEVIGERGHDTGERTTDDDTDGHVHHVAAERKLLKFFDEVFQFH